MSLLQTGHNAKVTYVRMTMEKDVNKLVEGYKKYTGRELKVKITPGAPGTTPSKINLEEHYNIEKYI